MGWTCTRIEKEEMRAERGRRTILEGGHLEDGEGDGN